MFFSLFLKFFLVVNLVATSSQELLDGFSLTFQQLVELCKCLINFTFIWQSLEGYRHGNQRNLKNWRFFCGKIFFVTLPFEMDWNIGIPMDSVEAH